MLDKSMNKEQPESPISIVARLNLTATRGDVGAISAAISAVLDENPKAIEDYRAGKNGAVNFLVGQVMRKTKGKADPGELNAMLMAALKAKEA